MLYGLSWQRPTRALIVDLLEGLQGHDGIKVGHFIPIMASSGITQLVDIRKKKVAVCACHGKSLYAFGKVIAGLKAL